MPIAVLCHLPEPGRRAVAGQQPGPGLPAAGPMARLGAELYRPEVRCITETPDGAIWIGMRGGGVARYRDGKFSQFLRAQGLPYEYAWALLGDADGSVWIGTPGAGLIRWRDGQFVSFTDAPGIAQRLHLQHPGRPAGPSLDRLVCGHFQGGQGRLGPLCAGETRLGQLPRAGRQRWPCLARNGRRQPALGLRHPGRAPVVCHQRRAGDGGPRSHSDQCLAAAGPVGRSGGGWESSSSAPRVLVLVLRPSSSSSRIEATRGR